MGEQHDWCSIYRCCVKKKGLITCVECTEYPCERYVRRKWGSDAWSKAAKQSLKEIKRAGLKAWLRGQRKRRLVLENLLNNYNDGRSMRFYCIVCILMPIDLINDAVSKMKKMLASKQIDGLDLKAVAKALRSIIQNLASKAGIDLKLGRK